MANKLEYHVRDFIENGRDFVLARIVATRGSSPRKEDSILLMDDQGTFFGTVGGGKVEAETEIKCREIFEEKNTDGRVYHFDLCMEEGRTRHGLRRRSRHSHFLYQGNGSR